MGVIGAVVDIEQSGKQLLGSGNGPEFEFEFEKCQRVECLIVIGSHLGQSRKLRSGVLEILCLHQQPRIVETHKAVVGVGFDSDFENRKRLVDLVLLQLQLGFDQHQPRRVSIDFLVGHQFDHRGLSELALFQQLYEAVMQRTVLGVGQSQLSKGIDDGAARRDRKVCGACGDGTEIDLSAQFQHASHVGDGLIDIAAFQQLIAQDQMRLYRVGVLFNPQAAEFGHRLCIAQS